MMKRLFVCLFLIGIMSLSTQTLHLYGGENHDVYLGCLNCDKYDSNSIWNQYGSYGSPYSNASPFNKYATNPPVVVDKKGNFYGYLTVNSYNNKRAVFSLAKIIYEYYEAIREDVEEWYEEIFEN